MIFGYLIRPLERARLVLHAAREIGREPAGHDQPRAALGAFGIEAAKLVEALGMTLEPRMHRSHDDTARERYGADADRIEQNRVSVRHAKTPAVRRAVLAP